MKTCHSIAAGLIMAAGSALPAAADVTDYAVGRSVTYIQTSDAPPATPDAWTFIAVIVSGAADEIESASVSFQRPPVQDFPLMEATVVLWEYLSPIYSDESTFLADFPDTTYTLNADRGAGPESGQVFLPADLYCEAIPAFTADTYTRMQGHNAAQTFIGTINGFTLNPGTTQGATSMVLVADSGPSPGPVWSASLAPGDTFFLIPAGTMQPDTQYSISVSYLNQLRTPDAGFGAATSGIEFARATTAYFTTRSAQTCDPDFNHDGNVDQDDVLALINTIAGGPCP
jgi:hypothetical protein